MSPPPRRLSFAVGTSLLGASLSLATAACDDADKRGEQPTVNPKDKAPEEDHVNVGPDEPDPQPEPQPDPPPEIEPDRVNEGPEPEPQPEVEERVNVQPEKPKKPEPKHVNVRAPD